MVQTKPRRLNGSAVETFGMLPTRDAARCPNLGTNTLLFESGVETVSVS